MADTRTHCRLAISRTKSCFLFAALLLASASAEVYIVTLDGPPTGGVFTSKGGEKLLKRRAFNLSPEALAYSERAINQHENLLQNMFEPGTFKRLYSYSYVMNGFAVRLSADQVHFSTQFERNKLSNAKDLSLLRDSGKERQRADRFSHCFVSFALLEMIDEFSTELSWFQKADTLKRSPEVKRLEKDWQVRTETIHTPEFLGLPTGIWLTEGGPIGAGEGIVIGIIDTGINPTHPSFSADGSIPYPPLEGFQGKCEEAAGVDGGFCNGKIVAAQHFSAAAEAAGAFNSSTDFASPLDGDGHGSHTAAVAAGNHGVQVYNDGFYFGTASGMAPRARISVYKALYRQFGGFVADVVAAIDQAAKDGVDVLNLSVGPSSPPSNRPTTFLNAFDVALLAAVKAGVLVVQAAGNGGPYPRTMSSFSPWIVSVGAGLDDREYGNFIFLGNGEKLSGKGLAPATPGDQLYNLVLAEDALLQNAGFLSNPTNCQQPEVFNKTLVEGKILMCTYSFSFVYGGSTVKRVSDTAQNLSAVGFVLLTRTDLPGTTFNPIPVAIPGIVITDLQDSLSLLNYYNVSESAAQAKIGNGLNPDFLGTAPQVALYSSRGPNVKNFNLQDADLLKPNILAPGSLIWAAWTPIGIDEASFQGQSFALMSGTSMATPHIAGIAALLKQKNSNWSPAAIASAMMTTASVVNNKGAPILAQHLSDGGVITIAPATPFDFGSGAINATAALDPGLIFDAGYVDYINFVCSVAQVDEAEVLNATGSSCNSSVGLPTDLNVPSITISNLKNSRKITRTVTNVASKAETYTVSYVAPTGISMQVAPQTFMVSAGGSVSFDVVLRVAAASNGEYMFGALFLRGDQGHEVRIPVSISVGNNS